MNEFGKFKSAQALLTAYGALEREFTRRSTELKRLKSEKSMPQNGGDADTNGDKKEIRAEVPFGGDKSVDADAPMESDADELRNPHPVLRSAGGFAGVAAKSPATLAEAGEMVRRMLL